MRKRMFENYLVTSDLGTRGWMADDEEHAREQHLDAFPDEPILGVIPERLRGGAVNMTRGLR
ncbi:hypothetical protein DQP56_00975 [Mycolicibacter senuensis]|uniref:Uncharacterized protein n=1 Tax=Mycolicibacter longobardus TaxID=1108812 RepID=A0A1X1YBU5_9MYCO|nr:hypothetical protein AWC16_18895 [Mycolicibacter longobardus]RAV04421.1 hypothetical protein DQP56_00975 [Mycolicibacter senuensis]